MNGFLVLLQHEMDDVPIGLYATEDEAMTAAKEASWQPEKRIAFALDLPDMSTPTCLSVVWFVAGVPVGRNIVRDYAAE